MWNTSSGLRHIVSQLIFLQSLQPPSHSSSLWSNKGTWTFPRPPHSTPSSTYASPLVTFINFVFSSLMVSPTRAAALLNSVPSGPPPPWTPPSDPPHPHKRQTIKVPVAHFQSSHRCRFPHHPLECDVKKVGRYGTPLPQSSPDFKHLGVFSSHSKTTSATVATHCCQSH